MILNKDHQAIRDTVSGFIEKEINPYPASQSFYLRELLYLSF